MSFIREFLKEIDEDVLDEDIQVSNYTTLRNRICSKMLRSKTLASDIKFTGLMSLLIAAQTNFDKHEFERVKQTIYQYI